MRIDVQHGDPGPFTLFDGAVSGVSAVLGVVAAKAVTLFLTATAGTTGGTVQLETSADPDFQGAWAPLGSPITVVPGVPTISESGLLAFIRIRITQPVANGTIAVRASCSF